MVGHKETPAPLAINVAGVRLAGGRGGRGVG